MKLMIFFILLLKLNTSELLEQILTDNVSFTQETKFVNQKVALSVDVMKKIYLQTGSKLIKWKHNLLNNLIYGKKKDKEKINQ